MARIHQFFSPFHFPTTGDRHNSRPPFAGFGSHIPASESPHTEAGPVDPFGVRLHMGRSTSANPGTSLTSLDNRCESR
jgi:hypothetical protein